jgi:RNA polymerase sigma-70 factor, ECF subfamily
MATGPVGTAPRPTLATDPRPPGSGSPLEGADDDSQLVAAVLGGDAAAFETLMRRHNRLLFRTARAILLNEADAEEVVQETYLKAYLNLASFGGRARLATWLVKIAVNESLTRLRRRMPGEGAGQGREDVSEWSMTADTSSTTAPHPGDLAGGSDASPEAAAAQGEIRGLLEAAIDALPRGQREVFMLRAVEEFSTEDTAACLGIPAETVKTRLHRAKRQLRARLQRRVETAVLDTFPFAGARCDRIVAAVFRRLGLKPPDG